MRIAVVDDSHLILDLLREVLEAGGHAVTCARDACEAERADAELLLADSTWVSRLPALDRLRILEKERGLGAGLRRALGHVQADAQLPSLLARYRPRFMAAARRRLARAIDLCGEARTSRLRDVGRELHGLGADAQLLALHDFAEIALAGELCALRWAADGEFADLLGCVACLDRMCGSLSQLAIASLS
jgi:hypothetical protein